MHLMRSLFFFTAQSGCILQAVHVEGRLNVAADALSRDNLSLFRHHLSLFRHQVPDAHPTPTSIPKELVELLVIQWPDWTSKNWKRLFNSISQRASPNLHSGHTGVGKTVI